MFGPMPRQPNRPLSSAASSVTPATSTSSSTARRKPAALAQLPHPPRASWPAPPPPPSRRYRSRPRHRTCHDAELPLTVRHAVEVAVDRLARLGERRLEVRIIRAPHQFVDADQVATPDPRHVVLERGVYLLFPVLGRVALELREARTESPGVP